MASRAVGAGAGPCVWASMVSWSPRGSPHSLAGRWLKRTVATWLWRRSGAKVWTRTPLPMPSPPSFVASLRRGCRSACRRRTSASFAASKSVGTPRTLHVWWRGCNSSSACMRRQRLAQVWAGGGGSILRVASRGASPPRPLRRVCVRARWCLMGCRRRAFPEAARSRSVRPLSVVSWCKGGPLI